MAVSSLKQAIVYRDEQYKNFCQRYIRDKADFKESSPSTVIEDLIVYDALCDNQQANFLIQRDLYPLEPTGTEIQDTLNSLFAYAGSGINWKARETNLKPLLLFILNEMDTRSCKFQEMAKKDEYVYSKFEDIYELISKFADNTIDSMARFALQSSAKNAKCMLDELKDNPYSADVYVKLIVDWWDDLGEWAMTAAFLSKLVEYTPMKETSKNRYKLLQLIKEASEEWK